MTLDAQAIIEAALITIQKDTIEECAKIAEAGAKHCSDGETEWHKGFRYAANSTALEIAARIRGLRLTALALSSQPRPESETP